MSACTLTHIGARGQAFPSFPADFPWAFSNATDWVGRKREAGDARALELRCHSTGTLYRIKAKRPAGAA